MKKILLPILLLIAATLSAQTTPAAPQTAPAVKCPPTVTLDQLIAAIDSSITGPADQDRTCFRDIFTPDARLVPTGKGADGAYKYRALTVDDWIKAVANSGKKSFTEKQIKYEVTTFANIAHIWSTYKTDADNQPLDRGINSIQAFNDGTRWRIVEVLWQDEKDNPIPAKFLP
jgi:hypothetical protein